MLSSMRNDTCRREADTDNEPTNESTNDEAARSGGRYARSDAESYGADRSDDADAGATTADAATAGRISVADGVEAASS